MSWTAVVPDVTPLRGPEAHGFRAMFASRTVAYLGSQASEVALLVQAQQITGSPLVVGTLGLAELVPLVVFGLYGGVLADRFDRRALMLWCEPGLGACAVLLLLNSPLPHPLLWPLFVIAGLMMALACLAVAGGADECSAVFRDTMWKQSIPDHPRGGMAGIELLSYAAGPPAGQLRSGAVTAVTSVRFSLTFGGLACVAAVAGVVALLPALRRYTAPAAAPVEEPAV